MTLYTIGFTKSSAEHFFERLRSAGVQRVIDVRLNNISQLAGFAKKDDLAYFLRTICGIEYEHRPELAPTQEMLDGYRKGGGSWAEYEAQFRSLITERCIESLPREPFDGGCLLCSEDTPEQCHRRIVADYLREHWGPVVRITHL